MNEKIILRISTCRIIVENWSFITEIWI